MKLLFYYPTHFNAPSNVGREIFHNIYSIKNKLSFDIAILADSKSYKKLKIIFPDVDLYSIKSIRKISKTNSVMHIPTSPFVAPNERFLFHSMALLKKCPLIINYHGDIQFETKNKIKNKEYISSLLYLPSFIMIPQILHRSNQVIVNSYLMNNLTQKKYKMNSCIIPNAINESWFKELDFNCFPNFESYIFYHGRLSYEKGVDILIQAYALCKKRLNIKTHLFIAGEGPQKRYLMALCKKMRIENQVKFLGFLTQDELKGYIKKADALFYPSRYEPFSLAILESLSIAQGPVFFSNRAGISDFVNNKKYNLFQFYPEINSLYKIMNLFFTDFYSNCHIITKQQEFGKKFVWKCDIVDVVLTECIKTG